VDLKARGSAFKVFGQIPPSFQKTPSMAISTAGKQEHVGLFHTELN
jgi:hypothetical protein